MVALAGLLGVEASAARAGAGAPVLEDRTEKLQPFPDRLLFDVGVVDFDGDDDLDVFTVNHNDRQGLLANRRNGFEDRLSAVGLDQSPGFPFFEVPSPPPISQDGVYVYRSGGTDAAEGALRLVVRAEEGEQVAGAVEFLFPVTVNRSDAAEVTPELDTARQPPRHVVRFTAQDGALIELEPQQMAAPIGVSIEESHPLGSIFVGSRGVTPAAHRFALTLRDRHGMAWADYDRDGLLDVFIARGGLKGRFEELTGLIANELMLRRGPSFRDATAASGLVKGTCRGRGAAPVDFNRDGLLDLFWACHGSSPALFRHNPDGTFSNFTRRLGKARIQGRHFEWLDVNGKGRDELIAARKHRLVVYRSSRRNRWSKREAIRLRGDDAPTKLAVADYDDDGDPDLFAPSPSGNTLLVNRSGHFVARGPGRRGLPKTGTLTASWVDYDNDGRTDLHAVPQGIFRRLGRRRFAATPLAATERGTLDALVSWFDYDDDGARDVLLAYAHPAWEATLLENPGTPGHWLEIELTGAGGAYPAAGARVRVRARDRIQTQWVGQSEGSRYSRGHYRLYFGLGTAGAARWVKVMWPDGSEQKLRRVLADQLLHVTFDGR